jgi:hypothetical protein
MAELTVSFLYPSIMSDIDSSTPKDSENLADLKNEQVGRLLHAAADF